MKRKLIWFGVDLMIAGIIVLGVWILNYKIPQKGQKAVTQVEQQVNSEQTSQADRQKNQSGNQTKDSETKQQNGDKSGDGQSGTDWREKFADQFTKETVVTDTSYTSPNLSIHLSFHQYDTGKSDASDQGKHLQYGTQISYILADVYIGDLSCFQTAFAQDTYGVGYTEKLSDMSKRMNAVLGINGDSYSNNRHRENGTIIRNGVTYRDKQSDAETCLLNKDGTMEIVAPGQIDPKQLKKDQVYQSWVFGPGLLDENGKAKTDFLTWDYIRQSHPRSAIGYYEPGHYCFLLVDGRQRASRGMFLEEMAKVFEDAGCKLAYNLDGGHCSFLTYQGQVINHPYKPEHEVLDGIFLTEGVN